MISSNSTPSSPRSAEKPELVDVVLQLGDRELRPRWSLADGHHGRVAGRWSRIPSRSPHRRCVQPRQLARDAQVPPLHRFQGRARGPRRLPPRPCGAPRARAAGSPRSCRTRSSVRPWCADGPLRRARSSEWPSRGSCGAADVRRPAVQRWSYPKARLSSAPARRSSCAKSTRARERHLDVDAPEPAEAARAHVGAGAGADLGPRRALFGAGEDCSGALFGAGAGADLGAGGALFGAGEDCSSVRCRRRRLRGSFGAGAGTAFGAGGALFGAGEDGCGACSVPGPGLRSVPGELCSVPAKTAPGLTSVPGELTSVPGVLTSVAPGS